MNEKLLNYFNGDELAADVWLSKYKIKDEKTPIDMFIRICNVIAEQIQKRMSDIDYAEINKIEIKDLQLFYYNIKQHIDSGTLTEYLMYYIDFENNVPGGSMLQGIGNNNLSSISNCFVIAPPHDSYSGISKTSEEMVQLCKRRGGVGTDISTIRPTGAIVNNQSKYSSGVILFAERFSHNIKEVAQFGRRGALMISLSSKHPDCMDFLKSKRDLTKLTGANISIKFDSEFFDCLKENKDYIQRFPVDVDLDDIIVPEFDFEYNKLIKCENKISGEPVYIKYIKSYELWNEFIESNWLSAEPGIMFESNWIYGPDYYYKEYKPVSSNPCGEINMQPYDSCRLLHLNLLRIINNKSKYRIDLDILKELTYFQMFLCDILIDIEIKHINNILNKLNSESTLVDNRVEMELWTKILNTTNNSRRMGIGFMGYGDLCALCGFNYGDEGLTEYVFSNKFKYELESTIIMSKLWGSFKGFNFEYENQNFLDKLPNKLLKLMKMYGRRNVSWSTAAPTGTVAMLAQTTSGIEPLFMPFYKRRKKIIGDSKNGDIIFIDADGEKFTEHFVIHYQFKKWLLYNYDNYETIISDEKLLNEAFEKSPWYNNCAEDINYDTRVKTQGIIQKYITHSISATINLPSNIDKEIISNIYLKANEYGLKGVTIYRAGSRNGILVNSNNENKSSNENFESVMAPKRPKSIEGHYHSFEAKNKDNIKSNYGILIGLYDNNPYEIYILCECDELPVLLDNSYLKGEIIKEYKDLYYFSSITHNIYNITDIEYNKKDVSIMLSTMMRHRTPLKYIIKTLQKTQPIAGSFTYKLIKILMKYMDNNTLTEEKCSSCGDELRYENGCIICPSCGNSKC